MISNAVFSQICKFMQIFLVLNFFLIFWEIETSFTAEQSEALLKIYFEHYNKYKKVVKYPFSFQTVLQIIFLLTTVIDTLFREHLAFIIATQQPRGWGYRVKTWLRTFFQYMSTAVPNGLDWIFVENLRKNIYVPFVMALLCCHHRLCLAYLCNLFTSTFLGWGQIDCWFIQK